jgi:O-antigen ligase
MTGVLMQDSSIKALVFVVGVFMIWILGASFYGMTVSSTLIMIGTYFLKPLHMTNYIAIGLLVILLLTRYLSGTRNKMYIPYPVAMSVLLLFGCIALSKTYVADGRLYFVSTVIVPILVFVIIRNAQGSGQDLLNWMRVIVIIATFVAMYGVLVAIRNPMERLGSTWATAMTINGFYTIAFFFAIGLSIQTVITEYRLLWATAAVIIFFGMLYTYTRIAMVAVLFGLFMLMLRAKKMRLYGLIAMGLMPLVIPSSMAQRIAVGLSYDLSILIRLIAWYNAMILIIQHPFTGIGFSTWQEIYHGIMPIKRLYAQHAHNLYINLALEMGLIGLIAYLSIIGKTLVSFYKKMVKPQNDIVQYTVLISVLAILVSCITDIFIQQYQISILFWVTLALMYNKTKDVSECKTLNA